MACKSEVIAYPLLGICSGQRPDESDQHGDASLNLPAHSRRTSTMAVRQTHLRRSQACGRWLLRPTYALCFGYPRRVHEEAPNPVSYTHLRAHETRHDLV